MVDGMKLRGLAIMKYGSLAKMATALGWSYSRLSRIVRAEREPTSGEIREMATALEITDAAEIVSVFSLS